METSLEADGLFFCVYKVVGLNNLLIFESLNSIFLSFNRFSRYEVEAPMC